MPYMELDNLYKQLDPSNNVVICEKSSGTLLAAGNAVLQKTVIPAYICPSATDPEQNWTRLPATASPGSLGKSNYAAFAGLDWNGEAPVPVTAPLATTGQTVKGMFVDATLYGVRRFRDILDGSSNVLAVGEKLRVDLDTTYYAQAGAENFGAYWVGIAPDTRAMQCVSALNFPPGTFTVNGSSINAYRSQHSGGCFFLLCDGHVIFLSENADQTALTLIGTVDDGYVNEGGIVAAANDFVVEINRNG